MILVTGASSAFFRSLQQLLLSLQRWGYGRCVVYDLGLDPRQRRELRARFGWTELRSLPDGPPHLRELGNYAWKPTVIEQVLSQGQEPIFWLDSACVVVGRLDPVEEHLARHGLWVPRAGRGPLREMTHPATLDALQVEPEIQNARFRAGGVAAFAPEMLPLVGQWRELAYRPDILAPPGSHRGNHRFDQTLLTVLIARAGLAASEDEIDISSAGPVPFLRTRNKVSNRLPLALDPLVRGYFWLRRALDVAHWRLLQRSLSGHPPVFEKDAVTP